MFGSLPVTRALRTSHPLAVLVAGLALALTVGCSLPPGSSDARGPGPDESADSPAPERHGGSAAVTPPAGSGLWVDPRSPAARQVARWEREGRDEDARVLRRMAGQPIAEWPDGDGDPGPRIREVTAAAGAAGQTGVFVAYNIPHRDCGQYSQGGAADAAAYRQWIGTFADSIGDAEAMVILEPDAVPHLVDGCTAGMYHEERTQLLAEAVDRLSELPRTRVYLDAGNPSWVTDPADLVGPLERSGIARADGFALNVSNYRTTERVIAYGRALSGLLDGDPPFVVDTSRNGNGPLEGEQEESWCNPPGRALGTPPTMETGEKLVDAFLWIKRPGESDGECRGGPRAGEWWPEYALGLAREAGPEHVP
ncbi:glycoside hydrolase family 6 protein [Streptomyces sp. ACA25]|uniref:glycoside hydrolase family 6 protein n=1 Tax=Streptomyces sp. ACA25 TaxID=3022596 RepID=UPI0023070E84|nr:glycoside hydrolase family 6 protein [Streptomyces sp. ACA25]MDB1087658.1 glycoside hydrolase family 6 protein [Streptomyces sp. ACA25]